MTKNEIIESLKVARTFPEFRVGDSIRVHVKIKEGEKERIQAFEGIVIKKRGGKTQGASFSVRKISSGIGVERTFPFECGSIDRIELTKQGKARRARLFYMRGRQGRAARLDEIVRNSPEAETTQQVDPSKLKTAGVAATAQLAT